MTTSTPHTQNRTTTRPGSRRAGTIFSAATGVGVGVGMALTLALAALTGLPVGIAMAIALPGAMIIALAVALVAVRREATPGRAPSH